jgi:hypothetical protein
VREQDRPAPRRPARRYVARRVAHHPASTQIEQQLPGSLEDHPRRRLAERAGLPVTRHHRFGVVRAELVALNDRGRIMAPQHLIQPGVDAAHVLFGEQPAGDAALVAERDDRVADSAYAGHRFRRAFHQHDPIGVAKVTVIHDQRVVAVKKNCRSVHVASRYIPLEVLWVSA